MSINIIELYSKSRRTRGAFCPARMSCSALSANASNLRGRDGPGYSRQSRSAFDSRCRSGSAHRSWLPSSREDSINQGHARRRTAISAVRRKATLSLGRRARMGAKPPIAAAREHLRRKRCPSVRRSTQALSDRSVGAPGHAARLGRQLGSRRQGAAPAGERERGLQPSLSDQRFPRSTL
jgi:hypothetical protein